MMNLNDVSEALRRLDEESSADGVARQYIVVRAGSSGEVVVEANKSGLIHLANVLVRLATASTIGKHYHLDEQGMADRAEPRVVFTYSRAEWDE